MGLVRDRTTSSTTRRGHFWLVCLGFACFFSLSPLGSLGTAALTQHAPDWQAVLVARLLVLCIGGLSIYCFSNSRWAQVPGVPVQGVALLAALTALCAGSPQTPGAWHLWVYAVFLGFGLGSFLTGWIQRFAAIYRTSGRMACVVAFSCAFLCSTAFSGLVRTMVADKLTSALVMGACTLGTWACFVATRPMTGTPSETPGRSREFYPTRYTSAIVASLGMTWALAFNLAPSLGFASPRSGSSTVATLLAYALCQAAVVVLVWKAGIANVHFGLLLRWIIAIIGIGWSFMPVCIATVPFVGCMAAVIVFLIESIVVNLFVIELARESRIPLPTVFRHLAVIFMAAACLASALYWAIWCFADPAIATSLTTTVAIIASVGILPLLPSRNSTAGVFTLERLPEDETVNARLAQARHLIARNYELTPREAEIFGQLVQGLSREEIARQLSISTWTVKNHTRAIYVKTKTHSIQELMALVYEGVSTPQE